MPGLYIHIPFCRSKCAYCDFTSYAGKEELIDAYLDALEKEAAASRIFSGGFETLYIGGGTPSLLSPSRLEKLFSFPGKEFPGWKVPQEITFEANCESLDGEKLSVLKSAGVNRLSLGLQTTNDRLLRRLGRPADYGCFRRAFEAAKNAGLKNINIDLMSALPGQSAADFAQSLEETIKLSPEHISLYALEVHEGAAFFRQGVAADEEAAADMYVFAVSRLGAAGYARYEISNFARPGKESRHNLNYWDQGGYLGLGCAASSHLDGLRWTNTRNLELYIQNPAAARENEEKLSGRARTAEKIMLGLRKTAGIELEDDIFIEFREETDRLLKAGLLERKGSRLKIKEDRFYVSNAVFREFV